MALPLSSYSLLHSIDHDMRVLIRDSRVRALLIIFLFRFKSWNQIGLYQSQARVAVLSPLSSIRRRTLTPSVPVPVHVETNESALKLSAKLKVRLCNRGTIRLLIPVNLLQIQRKLGQCERGKT